MLWKGKTLVIGYVKHLVFHNTFKELLSHKTDCIKLN